MYARCMLSHGLIVHKHVSCADVVRVASFQHRLSADVGKSRGKIQPVVVHAPNRAIDICSVASAKAVLFATCHEKGCTIVIRTVEPVHCYNARQVRYTTQAFAV